MTTEDLAHRVAELEQELQREAELHDSAIAALQALRTDLASYLASLAERIDR